MSSMRGALLVALILGAGVTLSAGSAPAQPPGSPQLQPAPWDRGASPVEMEDARRLFQSGSNYHHARLVPQAVEEYRRAVRLWPHPMIHYNLALALIFLDQLLEADEHLEQALAHGVQGLGGDPARFAYANQKRLDLSVLFARVVVSCQTPGARIFVDGKHVLTVKKGQPSAVELRIRTDAPLVHRFVAELPDGDEVVDQRSVRTGETLRVELRPEPNRRWPSLTFDPWAMAGTGVAIGVAGALLQSRAAASYQKIRECTESGQSCNPVAIDRLYERANPQRALGIAAYGIAASVIVATGVIAYLNRPVARRRWIDRTRREGPKHLHSQKSVSIAPFVEPGGAGAVVMGRF